MMGLPEERKGEMKPGIYKVHIEVEYQCLDGESEDGEEFRDVEGYTCAMELSQRFCTGVLKGGFSFE